MHSEEMSKNEIIGNTTIYWSHADRSVKPKRDWDEDQEAKRVNGQQLREKFSNKSLC